MRSSVKRIRRAAIEALEGRRLMTATIDSFTLDNYEAPIMSGSEVVLPGSLVEGMSQTASLNFHTDHDNLDGGVCHVHFDYGDPNCPPAQNSSDQWVANYAGASHVYNEAGTYVMTATVTDTAGDGTTYTWTAGSDEQAVYVAASEGSLGAITDNPDYSFEPNSPFVLQTGMAEFSDSSSATLDPSEYTGTIDWGDGNQSAAAFAIDPQNHAISVNGSHTYTYVMNAYNGDIAQPVGDFGEQIDNPVAIHVAEIGGGSIDIGLTATVHTSPWLSVADKNAGKDIGTATYKIKVPTQQMGQLKTTFYITGRTKQGDPMALPQLPSMTPTDKCVAMANWGNVTAIAGDPNTASFTMDYDSTVIRNGGDTLEFKFGDPGFAGAKLLIQFVLT